jgi:hypothetical protein
MKGDHIAKYDANKWAKDLEKTAKENKKKNRL